MKERIIVIPTNNKLSISLGYHNKNSFNTRFLTPINLVRDALLRSGIICDKTFISRNEELVYYKKIIEEVSYFKTNKLVDLKNINKTINSIRKLVVDQEEETIKETLKKGIFKNKNEALFEVYKKYIDLLNKDNKIDTIGLIRYAIKNANKLDTQIYILNEYPLEPLETKLVECLADTPRQISIFDLFEVKENKIHIETYKNCYGATNEVTDIIDDVLSKKMLDRSVIACGDINTYSQVFFDLMCKYNIPMTFNEGVALVNSYPGKLLKLYHEWSNDEGFGSESFFKLIYSPYFDFELFKSNLDFEDFKEKEIQMFYLRLSKLRLTNNININKQRIADFEKSISREDINDNSKLKKFVPNFKHVLNELSLPLKDFIDKYAVVRNTNEFFLNLDLSAKKTIVNEIITVENIGLEISDDVIENLLKKKTSASTNKPGHLHITGIENALMSLRDNLYISGLSSSIYPGSPKENPLLLDSDLKDFNCDTLTSNGQIKRKREALFNLIKLSSALNNTINLSYSGLDVSELKHNNPSSLMFEIYKMENGNELSLDDFKKHIITTAYFKHNLSKTKLIGEAYNAKKEIVYKALNSNNLDKTSISLNRYSPSALNVFFNCKKQFFYTYLLGINIPDDVDPYEVLSASEQGTLAHSLMEYLADHKEMSFEEFKKLAADTFDEYMKISVPLVKDKIDIAKEQFIEMLENGYKMDKANPREVDFKEEDKTTIHEETGIKIHGFPDRVENTKDGKAIIIDFKTERHKDAHIKDDIDTCLQVVIYAYIVEKELHKEIDHCEYRMLRYEDGIISCKYDEEIKAGLTKKLTEFKKALESGNFEIEPMSKEEEKVRCKYCKLGSICHKVVIDND